MGDLMFRNILKKQYEININMLVTASDTKSKNSTKFWTYGILYVLLFFQKILILGLLKIIRPDNLLVRERIKQSIYNSGFWLKNTKNKWYLLFNKVKDTALWIR
jgi:hypothetical protein